MQHMRFFAVAALLAGLAWALPALSQDEMERVPNTVFPSPQRSEAMFKHDEHNDKAGLFECGVCHHGETDGKADPTIETPGQPCAECHPVGGAPGRTPLMRAYHRQCVGCHHDEGKGPLTCGECHN